MAYTTLCKQKNLLEGDMADFVVEGKEVLVIWPEGEKLRAYHGICPHQQVPLKHGQFNGRIVVCPMHQWVFDAKSGRGLQPQGCALSEYPLRIEDGMVQVDVAPSLEANA